MQFVGTVLRDIGNETITPREPPQQYFCVRAAADPFSLSSTKHQHHWQLRQLQFFIGRQWLEQNRPHHGVDIPKVREFPHIRIGNNS